MRTFAILVALLAVASLARAEDDVGEEVCREEVCQVARAYALGERAVVGDAQKAATADDGERFFRRQTDGHGDAVESCVAAVLDHSARALCA